MRPGLLAVLAAVILAGCAAPAPAAVAPTPFSEDYLALLARFPSPNAAVGPDSHGPDGEQATTHALVLSAEALRLRADPSARSDVLAASARYLVDRPDDDGSGVLGWGLPFAYDFFADGSPTPQGAALAATTAFSVHALLDARSVLPAAEGMLPARAAAESLAAAACVSYARHAFTDANETGWFWLSEVDADRRFVANAAALLAGACRRALTEVPAAFGPADAALVESRVDATVLHVVASAIDGRPWWSYDALRPEEANGISQQARIVHGLAAYRGAGGAVALPWDDATLAATLLSFRSGDVLLEYAADGVAVPEGLVDRPARLWGVGMAAGAQACWGDREEAQRLIDGLRERYGPWPNLTLYPNDYSDDTRFYGRHAAYALWALAVVESPPDACLGGPESDMTP